MVMRKTPPGAPPSFEQLTPHEILAETTAILDTTSALHDHLAAALSPSTAAFANLVRNIADDANRAACRLFILSDLLSQLSPSAEARQAARQAEIRIADAHAKILMRHDVAALIAAVHARETTKSSGELDDQDRHLLSSVYRRYVNSGAALRDEDERGRLRAASKELHEICAAAQNTFIEPEEGLWFERSELAGVPESVLDTMVKDGTRIQVTFRRDHMSAVMCHSTSSSIRRRFTIANWHRHPGNIARLQRAIVLRDEIARMLGFQHHAALKMEDRMALSVEYVEAQLEDLYQRLKPVAMAETHRLLELYNKDPANEDNPVLSELYEWDKAYYVSKQREDDLSVDYSLLAEYFEVRHTLSEMLDLFYDLFGMEFHRIVASVWHESVICYQVWDTPSEGSGFLGYLYVDLYARDGKYRGAHCIGIQPGFVEQDGTKHYPATALVCYYATAPARPTLLRHGEVTTMFHELGHAIHNLVSRTKYSIPRSRDYSEIPSHLLENWTWVPDVLVRMGRHYTALDDGNDGQGALPRDLAEAVCRTRNPNRANAILAQVWPAMFDLAIHTPPSHAAAVDMDTTKIWNDTKRRVATTSAGPDPRDWGAGQARFVHMFRHNDAGYFSYSLSIAYAADIFLSTFAKDPMNAAMGRKWRYQVLEVGASRPEMEILCDLLGREPSTKAILDELSAR